jgi:hypothetical protein
MTSQALSDKLQDTLADASRRAAARFARLMERPQAAYSSHGGNAPRPCAVRVTRGLHQGASLRLHGPVTLGSDAGNEVVLRDPGVRLRHAELRRVDGLWGLFDLEDGRAVQPIETSMHGLYERRRYGVGASEFVLTQARPARAARRRFRQAIGRRLGPALLVMAAALGAVVIVQLVQPVSAHTAAGARTLSAEGFPDVRLIAAEGGAAQLSGYVDDAKALTRLQQWLSRNPGLGAARVQVRVGTELAARVQEALSNPALTVDYIGSGTVRIQGSSESTALRDQLHRLTLDLAGVVKIDNRVAFIEPAEAAPREHVLPVRIVDVVPGENGSFSNGSGARYFVGGVLPDGAEVVAIRKDGIEFSVAGRPVIYPLK